MPAPHFEAICALLLYTTRGHAPTRQRRRRRRRWQEENPGKIVEAHLLAEFPADFYGQEMRLLLAGWLRPERRFAGLPALLAAIRADISAASAALDCGPYAALAAHPYLRAPVAAGGDDFPEWMATPWAQACGAAAVYAPPS
jgi:hypothetical protein